MKGIFRELRGYERIAKNCAQNGEFSALEDMRELIYETAYQQYVTSDLALEQLRNHSHVCPSSNPIRNQILSLRKNIAILESWLRDYEPLGKTTAELRVIAESSCEEDE